MSGLQRKGSIQRQSLTCFGRQDRLTFVGNIGSLYNLRVSKTRAENVHTQLTSGNTLKLRPGQKAIQSAFVDNGTIPKLGREVWGKMHFVIYQKLENGQKEVKKGAQIRAKTMPGIPTSRLSYRDYSILHQWRCIGLRPPCRITPS